MSADGSSSRRRGPSNKATQTPQVPCNTTTTSGTQTATPNSGSDDQTPNPIHLAASSTMLPLVLSPDYNCGQCASAAAATGSKDSDTTSPVRDSAASSEPVHAEPVQPQLSVGLWTKPETAEDLLAELKAQTQRSHAAVAAVGQLLEDLEMEKEACLKLKEDVLKLIEKAGEKTRVLEDRARELAG